MPRETAGAWLWTLTANSLILLSGIVSGILAARLLLPAGRGAVAAVLFWPHIMASVAGLSANEAIAYRTSRVAEARTVVASAFWLAVGLSILAVLTGYWFLPYLLGPARSEWLSLSRGYLAAYVPLNLVALSLLARDHGELRFTRFNLFRASVPVVQVAGLVGLWAWDAVSVSNVVGVFWLGTFLAATVRIAMAREALAARPSWRETKFLLGLGCRFHPASLLALLGAQADRLVVISLWDDTAVGIYMVAFTVASAGLGVLAQAFQVVQFPNISRQSSQSAQRELLARSLRYAALLLVCATIPLMALSPWLIPGLFGVAFAPAVLPAVILLWGYVPVALRQVIGNGLRGLGEGRPGAIAEVLALSSFLVVAWPLGRQWGLAGISLAFLAANVFALTYLVSYLRRRLGLVLRDWWGFNLATAMQLVHGSRLLLKSVLAAR